jgi:hypothetical protein
MGAAAHLEIVCPPARAWLREQPQCLLQASVAFVGLFPGGHGLDSVHGLLPGFRKYFRVLVLLGGLGLGHSWAAQAVTNVCAFAFLCNMLRHSGLHGNGL